MIAAAVQQPAVSKLLAYLAMKFALAAATLGFRGSLAWQSGLSMAVKPDVQFVTNTKCPYAQSKSLDYTHDTAVQQQESLHRPCKSLH